MGGSRAGFGGPVSGLQGWGSLRATARPPPPRHVPDPQVGLCGVCALCVLLAFASLTLWPPRGSLLPSPSVSNSEDWGAGVSKLPSTGVQNPVLALEGINPDGGRPGPRLSPVPVAWWRDMLPSPWDPMWVSESQARSVVAGSLGSLAAASPCLRPQGASRRTLGAPSSMSRGYSGDAHRLYQLTCSPSSPSLSFPAAPLAFIPFHPGRPAGCPSPSSPCLPQPLVSSFGSWLWVLHLGSKQEAVWREGASGWEGGQSDLLPPWHPVSCGPCRTLATGLHLTCVCLRGHWGWGVVSLVQKRGDGRGGAGRVEPLVRV